jgi:transposase-like protein
MMGVSTRHYQQILPQMAETVGVSKSNVSREFIEASEQTLKALCERRFDDQDIVVVYIDGIQYGQIHVVAALGVDTQGYKHVLGLREGASENAHVVKDLLADLEAAMKAAFKLKAEEGMARLEKLAQWLDREYPSAAGSLREGLAELFTINRLGLPKALRRCLGSTNVMDLAIN